MHIPPLFFAVTNCSTMCADLAQKWKHTTIIVATVLPFKVLVIAWGNAIVIAIARFLQPHSIAHCRNGAFNLKGSLRLLIVCLWWLNWLCCVRIIYLSLVFLDLWFITRFRIITASTSAWITIYLLITSIHPTLIMCQVRGLIKNHKPCRVNGKSVTLWCRRINFVAVGCGTMGFNKCEKRIRLRDTYFVKFSWLAVGLFALH